jgi:hypothetical protein
MGYIKKILQHFPLLLLFYREFKFRFIRDVAEEKFKYELEKNQKEWSSLLSNTDTKKITFNSKIAQSSSKKILFVTGYGLGAHFQKIEPLVMMGLYKRGCSLVSLYCNQALPACEFNMVGNNCPSANMLDIRGITKKAITFQCEKCAHNVKNFYTNLPIDLAGFNEFLIEQDYTNALQIAKEVPFDTFRSWEIDGVAVGEEAFSSVLRATFCGEILDTIQSRALVERYLYAGILVSWAVDRAYKKLQPDRVVLIHGVYLLHGISSMVARKLGIPLIVMGGGGIRKDTVVACHNETYHRQLVSEDNSVWERYSLTDSERDRVLTYAKDKREVGAGVDYFNYHPNPINDFDKLIELIDIDRSKPIVSVYTNVLWDAQIFYSENVFSNMVVWLFETIELLANNKEVWGVIRIHPAEKKGGVPTNQPIMDVIKRKYKTLPSNIRIISPESDISSYVLAEHSKAAIIYGTKMGLEIALMGIPLVVCGESFSRNKGYGIDIKSLEEYADLISRLDTLSISTIEMKERAIRYAHYLYFRKMLDLPLGNFAANKGGCNETNQFDSLNDLAPGRFSGLDVLCDGIIDLKPLHHV